MEMMDKRNRPIGRNPVVLAILTAIIIGQAASLFNTVFGVGPASFSSVIPGPIGTVYNLLGLAAASVTMFAILRQSSSTPIGKYVVALLIEQYGKMTLGLVLLVYSLHSAMLPGGAFPFIVTLLGVGCIWRAFDIRKELKEIQGDLLLLKRIQQFNSRGGGDG